MPAAIPGRIFDVTAIQRVMVLSHFSKLVPHRLLHTVVGRRLTSMIVCYKKSILRSNMFGKY